MKGLCHSCFSTNVELIVTKGNIRCVTCENNGVPIQKVPAAEPTPGKLPFEDLPQATEQERLDGTERIINDINEKAFARYIKNERISEPLIDRIHDT